MGHARELWTENEVSCEAQDDVLKTVVKKKKKKKGDEKHIKELGADWQATPYAFSCNSKETAKHQMDPVTLDTFK